MESSPKSFRWYDYLTINIYWTGLTTLSQAVGLLFPVLIQNYVGQDSQGSYLGLLRLWTLMSALLVQGVMGTFSDRSHHPWGRRRPYIFTGSIMDIIFLVGIGFASGLEGLSGFWVLFSVAILLQISSNTAHAGQQGLIPDLVPVSRQGLFSGFKALFELPLPLMIVSFTIGKLFGQADFWMGLFLTGGVILIAMLLTMCVPEKRNSTGPAPLQWNPLIRLVLMTGIFTIIILGTGAFVRWIADIFLELTIPKNVVIILFIFLGYVSMLIAVIAGVLISIRISLGKTTDTQNTSFKWWIINRLAFFIGTTNLGTFAVYFIQSRLGYTKESAIIPAANLMLVIGITILLSVLPAGWIADRYGKKMVVTIAGFLATAGTWIVVFATNLTSIYIGGFFIGGAAGIFFTSNWALGTSLVPKDEAGKFLGISNLAGAGAGAIGAYIGGPIADYFTKHMPDSPGIGYVVLFSIYGLIFLFSSLTMIKVNETQKV